MVFLVTVGNKQLWEMRWCCAAVLLFSAFFSAMLRCNDNDKQVYGTYLLIIIIDSNGGAGPVCHLPSAMPSVFSIICVSFAGIIYFSSTFRPLRLEVYLYTPILDVTQTDIKYPRKTTRTRKKRKRKSNRESGENMRTHRHRHLHDVCLSQSCEAAHQDYHFWERQHHHHHRSVGNHSYRSHIDNHWRWHTHTHTCVPRLSRSLSLFYLLTTAIKRQPLLHAWIALHCSIKNEAGRSIIEGRQERTKEVNWIRDHAHTHTHTQTNERTKYTRHDKPHFSIMTRPIT